MSQKLSIIHSGEEIVCLFKDDLTTALVPGACEKVVCELCISVRMDVEGSDLNLI